MLRMYEIWDGWREIGRVVDGGTGRDTLSSQLRPELRSFKEPPPITCSGSSEQHWIGVPSLSIGGFRGRGF